MFLLDVNVLIALFDPSHVSHDAAHNWFTSAKSGGWATCPLTENACVRVLSHPNYPTVQMLPGQVVALLQKFCSAPQHQFWPDDVSLRDAALFDVALIQGNRQITDIYLLALAAKQGGKLATFDRSITGSAIRRKSNEVIELIHT